MTEYSSNLILFNMIIFSLCISLHISRYMVLWHVHEKAILTVTLPLAFAALAAATSGPSRDHRE